MRAGSACQVPAVAPLDSDDEDCEGQGRRNGEGPHACSTRIGDIVLLALPAAAVVLGRDGDRAVLDRTEKPESEVVAADGLVGGYVKPRGDGVYFGAHFRPVAIRRERVHG